MHTCRIRWSLWGSYVNFTTTSSGYSWSTLLLKLCTACHHLSMCRCLSGLRQLKYVPMASIIGWGPWVGWMVTVLGPFNCYSQFSIFWKTIFQSNVHTIYVVIRKTGSLFLLVVSIIIQRVFCSIATNPLSRKILWCWITIVFIKD